MPDVGQPLAARGVALARLDIRTPLRLTRDRSLRIPFSAVLYCLRFRQVWVA